ncbi:hypothetical protein DFH06DRAFT_7106 [Mycena polygramma]|nr:hypothetical protein DFH06DRAFT_7106 [Mycena polygramma]
MSPPHARELRMHLEALEDFFHSIAAVATENLPPDHSKQRLLEVLQLYHTKLCGTGVTPGVALYQRPRAPDKHRPSLRSISWQRILSGVAEAAKAARAAAFQERVSLSTSAPDIVNNPVEADELVIDFPPHLSEQLCHLSPGNHGWMFAVNKAVAAAFNVTTQSIRTVVRTSENGGKTRIGIYKVYRWFEADMYGAEFFQLSEQDQYRLVSRLTNESHGTPAFRRMERSLVLSRSTLPCLFLRHIPPESSNDPSVGRPQTTAASESQLSCTQSPSPSPSGHCGIVAASNLLNVPESAPPPAQMHVYVPEVQSRRLPAPIFIPYYQNGAAPYNSPGMINAPPILNNAPHRQPMRMSAPTTYNIPTHIPPQIEHRLHPHDTPRNQGWLPGGTTTHATSSYKLPPRITVPVLNYTPPTPQATPQAKTHLPSENLLHPHYKPHNRGLASSGAYSTLGHGNVVASVVPVNPPPLTPLPRRHAHAPPPIKWDQDQNTYRPSWFGTSGSLAPPGSYGPRNPDPQYHWRA